MDICYVQVEILYKLQLVDEIRTRSAVQVVTCTELHHQIIKICTNAVGQVRLKKELWFN